MPVGHARFNNLNADPNPSITFISVLEDKPDSDEAREILEALAAQFRPITKARGFAVGSLEEHEWNPQFGGKCWNHGDCIMIVLRRRNGSFAPYQWLLHLMCHELSHIHNSGHGKSFQKLNQELRADLAKLRGKGYYGDGFWSTGRKLTSGKHEVAFNHEELPTYTCGGSFEKRKSGGGRTQGQTKLGLTGRQNFILKKSGARVKKFEAFEGAGHVLDATPLMSSFRRHASSKSAIEARAVAAEERLEASKPKSEVINLCDSTEEESDDATGWVDDELEWLKADSASWESLDVGDEPAKDKGQGPAKKRVLAPAPAVPGRTWRATSQEREAAAKNEAAESRRRPPQKFFSTGTSAAKAHAQLGKERQAAYPSRQQKKKRDMEAGQPMLVCRPRKAALQPHEVAAKALKKGLKQRKRNERALVDDSDDE